MFLRELHGSHHIIVLAIHVPYEYSYIFKYEIDIDKNSNKITLPDSSKIKIFAVTVVKSNGDNIQSLQPLYDDFMEDKPYSLRN